MVCFYRFQSKMQKKKKSKLEMLHYIFIYSYLIFVDLVQVSFSHVNSGKQTLLVDIILNENLNPTG